jgi:lysophospholipase L1-like esterase
MVVTIKETGAVETVFSYGEYMRKFIRDVRSKGAYPVLCSLTPRNSWDNETTITRKRDTFTKWQQEIASEMNVPWIDLEGTTARKFEAYGPWKVNYMFYLDKIHTSEFGAKTNARSAAEAIAACDGLALKEYLLPLDLPKEQFVREAGKPVVFFTGDSTVKNEDKDENSMWGWASVAHTVFNTKKCTLVNAAKAGRSARTFVEEGRWEKVYNSIEPGDYVLIQFGHNDMGDIAGGKARADIRGVKDSSHVYRLEKDRTYKVVYSYGWYLRKFVGDVREKGGTPVIVSMTPRNEWPGGKMERRPGSCATWAKEVADELGVAFVDMHNLTADYLDRKAGSKEKAAKYYKRDHTHTSLLGAELNAKMFRKGIKKTDCDLKKLMK